jgi:hypothetical protein
LHCGDAQPQAVFTALLSRSPGRSQPGFAEWCHTSGLGRKRLGARPRKTYMIRAGIRHEPYTEVQTRQMVRAVVCLVALRPPPLSPSI